MRVVCSVTTGCDVTDGVVGGGTFLNRHQGKEKATKTKTRLQHLNTCVLELENLLQENSRRKGEGGPASRWAGHSAGQGALESGVAAGEAQRARRGPFRAAGRSGQRKEGP